MATMASVKFSNSPSGIWRSAAVSSSKVTFLPLNRDVVINPL